MAGGSPDSSRPVREARTPKIIKSIPIAIATLVNNLWASNDQDFDFFKIRLLSGVVVTPVFLPENSWKTSLCGYG
ncbi:hypothetical protein LBMAG16_04840 [Actinomycetes bacterium]|nr:hypothetical protein LBMAG16_04840 [Actinomycetes bacterium]